MKLFKSLTFNHLIFSLLLGGLVLLLHNVLPPDLLHPWIVGILIFYFIQGLLINSGIDWAKRNESSKLSLFLLGSVAFRLITSIFACIFVLLIEVELKELFIINFFGIYFIYLIFEMISLVANLRPNSNSQ